MYKFVHGGFKLHNGHGEPVQYFFPSVHVKIITFKSPSLEWLSEIIFPRVRSFQINISEMDNENKMLKG